jgi:phage shock protein E
MDNNTLFILTGIGIILGILLIKRIGLASKARALELIDHGAIIIDVRSEREYLSGHLPGTVNMPLDRIPDEIKSVAPDQTTPVLLYCLSGTRSDMARKLLRQMGYSQAYNLGSFTRARRILKNQRVHI